MSGASRKFSLTLYQNREKASSMFPSPTDGSPAIQLFLLLSQARCSSKDFFATLREGSSSKEAALDCYRITFLFDAALTRAFRLE